MCVGRREDTGATVKGGKEKEGGEAARFASSCKVCMCLSVCVWPAPELDTGRARWGSAPGIRMCGACLCLNAEVRCAGVRVWASHLCIRMHLRQRQN